MSEPTVSGLVKGRSRLWSSGGRPPRASASSTASARGCSTSSCMSSVGATYAALPST